MNYTQKFIEQKLIAPPSFIKTNMVYEAIVGSRGYGINNPDSDYDLAGIVIPSKSIVFPNSVGIIEGFGTEQKKFDQFRSEKVNYADKEFELTIYNIVRFCDLIYNGNPNIIEILFVSQECITHITGVGNILRDNRKLFLHKGLYHKFINYAKSQLHKMSSPNREGKRKELYEKWGFDIKFSMNLCRLILEMEQILLEGDLDLRKHSEFLKSIRRGEMTEQEVRAWFAIKEPYLEKLFQESKIPYKADEEKVKLMLLNCLEHHYGSLANIVQMPDRYEVAVRDIKQVLDKLGL